MLRGSCFPAVRREMGAGHRAWGCLLLVLSGCVSAFGGEIRLKDGTILPGTVGKVQSLIPSAKVERDDQIIPNWLEVADDGGVVQRFVPIRTGIIQEGSGLQTEEAFKIPQKLLSRNSAVQQVGPLIATPFDEKGLRTVTLKTGDGKDIPIQQGITRITPKYSIVKGLSYDWTLGVPTASIPQKSLRALLHGTINEKNAVQRLSIARFYTQALLYQDAQQEMQEIRRDFPDQEDTVKAMQADLHRIMSLQVLGELKQRMQHGQYQMVAEMARLFPEEGISGGILQQVEELIAEVDGFHSQIEQLKTELAETESQLTKEQIAKVAPLRGEINERLNPFTLPRFQAYRNLKAGGALPASEAMALAITGWLIGNEHAQTDLEFALRLAQARDWALEYVRSPVERRRSEVLSLIQALPGIGAQEMAWMIPLLPPLVETPGVKGGETQSFEIPGTGDQPAIQYALNVPPEYQPGKSYPLIVQLHPAGVRPSFALRWWAGNSKVAGHSQRQGYFVLAPLYAPVSDGTYQYSAAAHQVVLESIKDVRRRFQIDSNRIYLAGHGSGGDAAWDIGLAHPDQFAGIIPVSGYVSNLSKFCRRNCKYCPMYIINGELDLESTRRNYPSIMEMMIDKLDLIYVEYMGYGRDDFHIEIVKLMEWMSHRRRMNSPKDFEVAAVRPTDRQFWWWTMKDVPNRLAQNVGMGTRITTVNGEKQSVPIKSGVQAMTLHGKITPLNGVILDGGGKQHSISLSPDLVDFKKRIEVRVNGAIKFNQFLKPDVGAMLEQFRQTADRERLVWARVDL
ncbi:MAG: hypothetical protein U0903_15195 [Planctomycetales bacterium]